MRAGHLSRTPTLLLALIATGCTGLIAGRSAPAPDTPPSSGPNVVVVLTDDQRADTLWAMPVVRRELAGHGVRFRDAFVVNPICCPSRASILTGGYSHTTEVWANGGKHGGFDAFDDADTLATRLQAAGYHTGLVGKYLNHYDDPAYRPPGWSSWQALLAQSEGKYYDYTINDNGTPVEFGREPADYSTDVLMGMGASFIEEAPADRPLFLYLATKAPHGTATPAPRHSDLFGDRRVRFNASWDEGSVSDKPRYLRSRPPLGPSKELRMREGFLQASRALAAVDEGVGNLLDALEETGRLENSIVIFLSDNGTAWGEHRWSAKSVPHEETIRVPLVIRDGREEGAVADAMALNIDVAPTILDFASAPSGGMDGQSLRGILTDPGAEGRSDFLIEHMQLIRPEGRDDPVPSYCALRTRTELFVQYATGEREYYRLPGDPAQLHNLAGDPRYADRVATLHERAAAGCVPLPPDFPAGVMSQP